MRKEASLNQWKTLYEYALQLKALEPWRFFMNVDPLKVEIPEKDPAYIFFLGHHGLNYGITLYDGNQGLASYIDLTMQEETGIPQDYLFYNQQALHCYFGDRADVPTEQYKIIKELGYRFRGKNQWVYFSSLKPYFEPYIPDEEEVERLIEVYEQLIPLVEAYINRQLKVDFDNEEVLVRTYHADRDEWENHVAPLYYEGKRMVTMHVNPEDDFFQWLINQPTVNAELEIDLNYLFSNIEELEEEYGRPVNPKFVLLADHVDGFILKHEVITNQNEEADTILEALFTFIERFGIPQSIHFRIPEIGFILKELCPFLGIDLIPSRVLPACDEFYVNLLSHHQ